MKIQYKNNKLDARALLRKLDNINIEDYELLHKAGIQMIKDFLYEDAIELYTKLIDFNAKDKRLYYYISIAFASTNNMNSAIKALDNAIEIDSGFKEAYLYRGILHAVCGKLNCAADDFENARGYEKLSDLIVLLNYNKELGNGRKKDAQVIADAFLSKQDEFSLDMELSHII
ncbi:MAG: hypothetical protein M1385_00400 [Candidatus Marsarchaeota archaeon]|nr:hypothetical protein [Candidatus Marsarchaeota archaeon]